MSFWLKTDRASNLDWSMQDEGETRQPIGARLIAKTDLEIANAAVLRPIVDVAADIGLAEDQLDLYTD